MISSGLFHFLDTKNMKNIFTYKSWEPEPYFEKLLTYFMSIMDMN